MTETVSPPDIERLKNIARRLCQYNTRFETAKDSRAIFTRAYLLITDQLIIDMPRIEFDDARWVVTLAEAFADEYFRALDDYDAQTLAPGAWLTVLDAIIKRRTSVVEELLLSMSAHLIHDLPVALCRAGASRSRIRDFHRVNDILGNAIRPIRDEIAKRYSPYIRFLDRLMKDQDEAFTNYGFRLIRGMAWYNAERLSHPPSSAEARLSIEDSPREMMKQVLDPPLLTMRVVWRLVRVLTGYFRRWPHAEM